MHFCTFAADVSFQRCGVDVRSLYNHSQFWLQEPNETLVLSRFIVTESVVP